MAWREENRLYDSRVGGQSQTVCSDRLTVAAYAGSSWLMGYRPEDLAPAPAQAWLPGNQANRASNWGPQFSLQVIELATRKQTEAPTGTTAVRQPV